MHIISNKVVDTGSFLYVCCKEEIRLFPYSCYKEIGCYNCLSLQPFQKQIMIKRDIFKPRENIKPYEYPRMIDFVNAIDDSFWTVRKFSFKRDIMEYNFELSDIEKSFTKRSMLAISQVENQVKTYFGSIHLRLPKPEIAFAGAKLAANEVTHSLAYAQFLDDAGLNEEFKHLVDVPCMQGRLKYLEKYTKGLTSRDDKEFLKSHILFTLLVENISLYAPFLCMSATKKYSNKMKSVGKVIQATAREEQLHTLFGVEIIKYIREENPTWFDEEMEQKIRRNIRKAIKAEEAVIEWIFEVGEPDYLSKEQVLEYLKFRANNSLELLGYAPEYEINKELRKASKFIDVMLKSSVDIDFFDDRATDYQKGIDFEDEDAFTEL